MPIHIAGCFCQACHGIASAQLLQKLWQYLSSCRSRKLSRDTWQGMRGAVHHTSRHTPDGGDHASNAPGSNPS